MLVVTVHLKYLKYFILLGTLATTFYSEPLLYGGFRNVLNNRRSDQKLPRFINVYQDRSVTEKQGM